MDYILLLVGFGLLIKGADFFVTGSSNIAAILRIPPILIGLTIVSFGTSSPEATVSIIAALEGSSGVAIGNVIGSNIFNITLVVGLTAIIAPLKVESETIRKEIPFALLASVILLVLVSDVALQTFSTNLLTRADGLVLLLFFAVFLYYIFEVARTSRQKSIIGLKTNEKWSKNIFISILGLGAIIFGGDLVVKNSTTIANTFGMSETLVGLTIVAVGTSLPELVTSITAAIKKQSEIALGNIVGSNIFNILFVLGASSTVAPLLVSDKIFIDITLMVFLTIVLLLFSRTRFTIGKYEGFFLAMTYILYLSFVILRN
jgi:cation:H+ antiporter